MILILGFFYGQEYLLGAVFHLVLVTSLGVWFGYVWFRTRSTVQAAFMHAVFNANSYGIWSMIFVSGNKLQVGSGGMIGVVGAFILALVSIRLMQKSNPRAGV